MVKSKLVKSNLKKAVTRSQNSRVKKQPELIDLASSSRNAIPEIITLDTRTNRQKRNSNNTCHVIDLDDDDITVLPARSSGPKLKNSGRNLSKKDVSVVQGGTSRDAEAQSALQTINEMSVVPFGRELSDTKTLPNSKNANLNLSQSKCLALPPSPATSSISVIDSLSQCLVPVPAAKNSASSVDSVPAKGKELCVSAHPSPNFVPYKRSFALPAVDEINRLKEESSTLASVSNKPCPNPSLITENAGTSSSNSKTGRKSSVKQSVATDTNRRYALRSRGAPVSVSSKSVTKNGQDKKLAVKESKTSDVLSDPGCSAQSDRIIVEPTAKKSQRNKAVANVFASVPAVKTSSATSSVKPKPKGRASPNKGKKGKMPKNTKLSPSESKCLALLPRSFGELVPLSHDEYSDPVMQGLEETGARSVDRELDFIPIPPTPRRIENKLINDFQKNRKKRALRAEKKVTPKTKNEGTSCHETPHSHENRFSSEFSPPKSRREIKRLNRKLAFLERKKINMEKRKKKAKEELKKPQSKQLKGLINRLRQNLYDVQSMNMCGENLSFKQRAKLKRKLKREKQKLGVQLGKLNVPAKSQKKKPIRHKQNNLKRSQTGIESGNAFHSTPFGKKPKRCSESPIDFSSFNWITLDACQTDFDDQFSETSDQDFNRSRTTRSSSDAGPSCSKAEDIGNHSRSRSRLSRPRSESEESCQEIPLNSETVGDDDITFLDDGKKLSSDDAASDDVASDTPIADDAISLSSEDSFSKGPVADDNVSLSSEESFSIDIGTNVFVPGGVSFKGRRPIIIDGSNVAIAHGLSTRGMRVFSSRGLEICAKFFTKRGHKVIVFVPLFRRTDPKTLNPEILQKMCKKGLITFTPSRKLKHRLSVPYDDRYIVQCAVALGGVIVSTDNYKDLLKENRTWKSTIEKRLLMFTFVGDMLMFPQDPLGRHGPKLDDFLMFPR